MIQSFPTIFAEARVFVPDVFEDDRGFFKETWSDPKYADLGLDVRWAQDSCSWSTRNVLRGLHYDFAMAKLVQCVKGRIWDAIVDLRRDSPTYLKWQGFLLSDRNHKQLYVPAGFGHGFLALDDEAVVYYKNSVPYDPSREGAVLWCNTKIGVGWPLVGPPRLSAKDAAVGDDFLP
ncbi:MAG TPA: dTDP-4-dehydrorhamnose 3,5-epimerase [Candidatus Elarobacter sp.]|jgi:dTDP-4-dehydrorhamnose 3,5-epimerase